MISFTVDSVLRRIVFGAGTFSRLPEEVEHIGAKRVMIISTPGRTDLLERASSMLGATVVARIDRAVVHVPEQTAASAREMAAAAQADCLVTLGGGSAIGAAKAVAVDSGVPIVAVATTYGGSEMTPIYGFTSAGQKRTGRDPRARPRAAIYDSDLTLTLPPRTTAWEASGRGCAGEP